MPRRIHKAGFQARALVDTLLIAESAFVLTTARRCAAQYVRSIRAASSGLSRTSIATRGQQSTLVHNQAACLGMGRCSW
jgi:hypothetical protein